MTVILGQDAVRGAVRKRGPSEEIFSFAAVSRHAVHHAPVADHQQFIEALTQFARLRVTKQYWVTDVQRPVQGVQQWGLYFAGGFVVDQAAAAGQPGTGQSVLARRPGGDVTTA